MKKLNKFFESIWWPIWYLFILGINIVAIFYHGFSWGNLIMSVILIVVILFDRKEFFKPFKVWFIVNKFSFQINRSNLSKEDKEKAIKGIKRIIKEEEAWVQLRWYSTLRSLFFWGKAEEGLDFWNKVNQVIKSKQK